MNRPLSQAWGQFLSQFSWDWFVTLTFRDWVKSFRAHRLFGYFVRDLEQAAGQPIFWFRADEIGPQGGRFHLHALVGNVGHLRRMFWVDYWNELAGFARILPFSPRSGAAYYCAKYVTKQFGDWELSDDLKAFGKYQPALTLDGATKRPLVKADAQEARGKTPTRRRHSMTHPQLPYTEPTNGSVRESPLTEVYRSEVTRGRGRYKEFIFPDAKTR